MSMMEYNVIPVIIVANESDLPLIFMMLDPELRQSVSWMQLHASGESTGFLSLSTPVRRHACFQLAANQSSLMIACGHVMLMMFSCRIHSDPCPAVRLSIMISFMLMLIVKLSNDPREPAFMCNHERIMFSCFIIVGMARIERAFSPSRKERIPIFPSFRMALFSIINIKSPGTIFVPLYGSGTCLC